MLGLLASGLTAGAAQAAAALAAPPVRDLDAAARIGRAALAEGALPADAAALRRELDAGAAPVRALFARDWRPAIRSDFAAGRIVRIAGWQLSRTEAGLCALAALD